MSQSSEYDNYLLRPKRGQCLLDLSYVKSIAVDWSMWSKPALSPSCSLSPLGLSTAVAPLTVSSLAVGPSLKLLVPLRAPEHRCYMI